MVHVRPPEARDPTAFSYGADGTHYLVRFLREYARDPSAAWSAESALDRFYRVYPPAGEPAHGPLERFRLEFRTHLMFLDDARERIAALLEDWRSRGGAPAPEDHWFGPRSPEAIAREKRRIVDLYESIRTAGYAPERFGVAPIRGYRVEDAGRRVFLVVGGHHRMAALSALGVDDVRCELQAGFPERVTRETAYRFADEFRVISRDDVDRWFEQFLAAEPPSHHRWRQVIAPDA